MVIRIWIIKLYLFQSCQMYHLFHLRTGKCLLSGIFRISFYATEVFLRIGISAPGKISQTQTVIRRQHNSSTRCQILFYTFQQFRPWICSIDPACCFPPCIHQKNPVICFFQMWRYFHPVSLADLNFFPVSIALCIDLIFYRRGFHTGYKA